MERSQVRCAIYTRQSVVRPGTDFTSCDAQHDACLSYVRAYAFRGWVPVEERFDDVGQKGATMERPALERLLHRIREGAVDRVVVHRVDRLTRRVSDWATLVGTFRRHHAELSVVAGDFHTGEMAMSDVALNVLATFAEFEREIIGERLRDARAALRAHGLRNAGRVPYGYSSDPLSHQLVPRPERAAVVKRIFEMAADGVLPSAIAEWLNFKCDRDRHLLDERAWSARSVLRILRNDVYLGRIADVADTHDAIVDDGLFARAGAAIDARSTRASGRPPKQEADLFLLRGLIRCVRCEQIMTTSSSRTLPDPPVRPTRLENVPPRYYRCRGSKPCPGSQVAADEIEQRVLAWLREPTGKISPKARVVLESYAKIWDVLWPQTVRRAVAQLVWEVRWSGPRNRLTVVLDEIAIAEAYASMLRRDEELAAERKARRKRPRRRRRPKGKALPPRLPGGVESDTQEPLP